MNIEYRYYSSTKIKTPSMSDELAALIRAACEAAFPNAPTVRIIHLGTVGDERHRNNPKSYHLHEPPDAIDIQAVSINVATCDLSKVEPWREKAAEIVTKCGGKCYHTTDKSKGHLHVQVGSVS